MLIAGVAEGMTQAQAAILAGYSQRSAAAIACKTLKKVKVRSALYSELTNKGIAGSDIIKPLLEALEAIKLDKTGRLTVDHNVRLNAVNTILKLIGVVT